MICEWRRRCRQPCRHVSARLSISSRAPAACVACWGRLHIIVPWACLPRQSRIARSGVKSIIYFDYFAAVASRRALDVRRAVADRTRAEGVDEARARAPSPPPTCAWTGRARHALARRPREFPRDTACSARAASLSIAGSRRALCERVCLPTARRARRLRARRRAPDARRAFSLVASRAGERAEERRPARGLGVGRAFAPPAPATHRHDTHHRSPSAYCTCRTSQRMS